MERRNTIQRDLVLNAVRSLRDHATAEEIYEAITKEYPNIGKGTVYRNLGILAEDGEILKISLPGEPDRYDHTVKKHQHCKCIKCGRIYDVEIDLPESFGDKITNDHGIKIVDVDILFKGICPDCQ